MILRGMSRRALLSAGAVALGQAAYRGVRASGNSSAALEGGFGGAKRCILLFMWGGPSHLDTFDPKPEAPAEVRGPFQSIPTAVPGLQFSEHFKRVAGVADKLAVVRSLTHDDPAHLSSAHTLLTGHLPPVNKSDAEPPSDRDSPHLGSVISRLSPVDSGLPSFVTMPWLAYHPAAPGGRAPGQNAGYIGARYDPLLIEGDPNAADWKVPALKLMDGITDQRLADRRRLLQDIELQQAGLERHAASRTMSAQQDQAFGLLASPKVRKAFDLAAEPSEVRERYGRNTHGQCVMLARRLAEHGVPFVSVNWQQDNNPFWDTHGDNFNKLQNNLIPPADQALAALLADLDERGMLDDTIVAWVGEFGRTPTIVNGTGREHHPWCYSGLLAGGGIRGGAVYGRSDASGFYPEENPVSPHDFTATLAHALGIPHEAAFNDRLGRPRPVYGGKPMHELFG
jgi:uncharacterized protein (DUF1501 family)